MCIAEVRPIGESISNTLGVGHWDGAARAGMVTRTPRYLHEFRIENNPLQANSRIFQRLRATAGQWFPYTAQHSPLRSRRLGKPNQLPKHTVFLVVDADSL